MSQIDISGVRLNYTDSGEKELPVVILMHGWGCSISTLASIEAVFKGKMRVINIDLPGHGESSEPPYIWGVEDFTKMLEVFVDRLAIKKPSLLGHSFGGRVAILYASRNDVDKLVLVDAAGIKPRRSLNYYVKVYSFKAAKKILPILFGRKKGESLIESWRGKAGSADYRQSSATMRGVMSRCVNEDLKSYMPSIKAPTLLVWGEEDTATPLSDAKTMESLIPDAGLASFPACGHYSFLDNPVGFKSVMTVFFADRFKSNANSNKKQSK